MELRKRTVEHGTPMNIYVYIKRAGWFRGFFFSYRNNARRASEIFADQPSSALDTAMYWVEYVTRHGRHKARAHGLNWYQYFAVDVTALIVSVCTLTIGVIYKSAVYLFCTGRIVGRPVRAPNGASRKCSR